MTPFPAAPVLVLDIGGTHVRTAVYRDGVLHGRVQRTWADGSDATEDFTHLAAAAAESRARAETPEVGRASAALAALVDPAGRVVAWPNRPSWAGHDAAAALRHALGLPCTILDDGNAALLAEAAYGAARDWRDFALISVGTGVGGAVSLGGRLVRGARGWAGEIGHWVAAPDGPPCACGRHGCLQALASGRALEGVARAQSRSFSELLDDAEAGSPPARDAVALAGRWLGLSAGNLTGFLDLEGVVISGRLAAHPVWWAAALDGFAAVARAGELRRGGTGEDAALLGAAALKAADD